MDTFSHLNLSIRFNKGFSNYFLIICFLTVRLTKINNHQME